MDPRHEPQEQELLNKIIAIINLYIQENIQNSTDDLFINGSQQIQLIEKICQCIYGKLNIDVNVQAILAKKNLLSTDVVYFPLLKELEVDMMFRRKEFSDLSKQLATHLEANTPLTQKIRCILNSS